MLSGTFGHLSADDCPLRPAFGGKTAIVDMRPNLPAPSGGWPVRFLNVSPAAGSK